jgi:beta-glucoside kinase
MKYVCFDIGGTNVKYGLLDQQGNLLSQGSFPTIHSSKEEFVESLVLKIKKYEKKEEISGIGISLPGVIEPHTGKALTAGALYHLYGENIKDILSSHFSYPINVENDANCALMAEYLNGEAQELDDVVLVTIGTGIGGAILSQGKIVYGRDYKAGEFGMMRINVINQPDVTLHELASTSALINLYREKKSLSHCVLIDGEKILREMETDTEVREVVNEWLRYLATGLFNIVVSFNPQKLILGGGISANPKLLSLVEGILKDNPHWQDFQVDIQLAKYRNDAGLIGALSSLVTYIDTNIF